MIDNYIAEVREELNNLVGEGGAELNQGEILILSQKLDKLIFVRQTIAVKRLKVNYKDQLQSFLSPVLYTDIKTC